MLKKKQTTVTGRKTDIHLLVPRLTRLEMVEVVSMSSTPSALSKREVEVRAMVRVMATEMHQNMTKKW